VVRVVRDVGRRWWSWAGGGRRGAGRRASRLLATLLGFAACLGACAARPPRLLDDGCAIFDERRGWYVAARESSQRWGVPIHVQLAIIHQESRFRADAKPPRRRILWILPGPRKSDAAGYAQALDGTWGEYRRESGNGGADRDDFADAADFVGWYAARSARELGIAKDDALRLYLAYHEGNGGFRRGTHRGKPWLMRTAWQVADRAERYRRQLVTCEDRFQRRWWQLW
jgi:hypothetical protein